MPCELVVVPGMYHAAERFRGEDPRMVEFTRSMVDALGRGLQRRTADAGAA